MEGDVGDQGEKNGNSVCGLASNVRPRRFLLASCSIGFARLGTPRGLKLSLPAAPFSPGPFGCAGVRSYLTCRCLALQVPFMS